MKVKNLSFTAVFIEDPEGGYSAFIEEIPGANSQGETLEEAKENVVEALHMVLETNKILAQKNIGKGVKTHRESLVFT